ncbi:MAG TPA: hypothetical protein VGA13_11975 [Acidimicrobiales bacterium]|jgi:hypothetical protein
MARWSTPTSSNGSTVRRTHDLGPSVNRSPFVRIVALIAVAGLIFTMVGTALLVLLT